jgi:hypothetical protein
VSQHWFEALGRKFEELVPLTTEGAFRLLAGREACGGEARVIVVGAGEQDAGWAGEQLDAVARAHAQIECRYVPRVAERGDVDGVGYVALRCDAGTTLEVVVRWAVATRYGPMPGGPAMGLGVVIGEAMRAAHRTIDWRTGAPLCMGSLGACNVLLSRDGRPWVVGFGHDVAGSLGPQRVAAGSHQAPEVERGAWPTPASDVYVLDRLMRAMLPYVEVLPRARLASSGRSGGLAVDAAQAWAEGKGGLTAALPADRLQSIDELMGVYDSWWRDLGVAPDIEGCVRYVAELQRARTDAIALTIARDASGFLQHGDVPLELASPRELRR